MPDDDDFREEIRRRLAGLRLAPAREIEIVEELTQHVETRHAELVSRGHPEAEARRQALEELDGHGVLATELARAVRPATEVPALGETHRGSRLEQTWQDVRFGARMLARHRGYTLVAVLTLALGIGANTAIFTLVNAMMLRPLPFPEPDRLYNVSESNPSRGWTTFGVSHPNYLDWRRMNRSFTDLAAWGGGSFNVASGGDSEVVPGLAITASFLPVLGVAPVAGRNFLEEEDRPGGPRVALLGHAVWQRRFGGDPSAIGRTVSLDDEPFTIVGVLPASFSWGQAEVFVPRAPDPMRNRSDHRFVVFGRLKPGITPEQARTDMTTIADQLAQSYPDSNKGWTVRMQSFYDAVVPDGARQMLLLLLAAAGFVLLIAASNVANLTLARASSRRR
jgi:putative ABC transport system permease protein